MVYNTWEGYVWNYKECFYAYQTPAGQAVVNKFLRELTFEIICGSVPELNQYVLDWISSKIRFPWQKLVSTLNLYSAEQRVGKGYWANCILKGLGVHFGYTSNRNQLIQRFTSHLAKYIVLVADECSFANDKKAHGQMKAFVTEPKMAIEAKFEEIQIVRNLCNLICISNDLLSTYADAGDLREVCLRCDPKRAGDWRYFKKLDAELSTTVDGIEDVGFKALFFYFAYDHKIRYVFDYF